MSTPRTHDDGRNERQRQVEKERQENTASRGRAVDKERSRQDGAVLREDATPRQRLAAEKDEEGFVERMREEKQRPDYIERSRPDDPSDNLGQLTRDNVNPDIPSAEPGTGPIVQPESNSAGVAPPAALDQPEQWPQRQKVPASGEYQKGDDLQQQHSPREGEPVPMPDPLRAASINEPPGSNVIPGIDTGPNQPPEGAELPPLVLTDISPDTVVAGSPEDLVLTVTGSGFGPNCVVMVDDEDMATTLVNSTTLTASVPVAAEPGIVDVEVARGEDLSDVLTFEFVAPAGRRSSEKAERKPKKTEPRGKRQTKDKKGKR